MSFELNFGIDNKVDAINQVLTALGTVGITSEEELDWNIDAGDANKTIDAVAQKMQINKGKGWWFNRENFHKLKPDPITGVVAVPANVLSAYVKRNKDGSIYPISLRGRELFSQEFGSDLRERVDHLGNINCLLVVNLPFDSLPATAKQAATDAARFWAVNDKEGDKIKLDNLSHAAQESFIALQAEDASQKRRNAFNNPAAQYQTSMMGGLQYS